MDNEKLLKERNEKLALWSGFVLVKRICDCQVCKSFPDYWMPPDGTEAIILPWFTSPNIGLSLQYKWLVPEITRRSPMGLIAIRTSVSIDYNNTDKLVYVSTIRQSKNGMMADECIGHGEADEPAQALAEAIEKYMDWVKENEGNG